MTTAEHSPVHVATWLTKELDIGSQALITSIVILTFLIYRRPNSEVSHINDWEQTAVVYTLKKIIKTFSYFHIALRCDMENIDMYLLIYIDFDIAFR